MRRSFHRTHACSYLSVCTYVLLTVVIIAGCHHNPQPSAEPQSLDSIAQSYVRLSIALGERDPDSLDFSIAPQPIAAAIHRSYPSLASIARDASLLSTQIHSLNVADGDRPRLLFLELQTASIQSRAVMLLGHTLDFDSEAHALFNTTRLPDTQVSSRAELRRRILALLPAQSVSFSTPAQQYAAYDRRFLVPPTRLAAVMNAALDTCRQRTRAFLTLPAGESVDLTFVRNQPWSAFSRYRGHLHSTIQLNLDLPITVDDALELACHEGYPGHHVFNSIRDVTALQQHLPEAQVQLTFSPQSYLSEAAAAYAPRLVFTNAERMQVERDILFPLAGLPPNEADRYVTISSLIRELSPAEPAIAREYLDGRLEFVRAGQRLASEMLMAHPEASLLYLNEYRTYMLAYTDGPRRIAAYLNPASTQPAEPQPSQRRGQWQRYEQLMRNPQITLPQ